MSLWLELPLSSYNVCFYFIVIQCLVSRILWKFAPVLESMMVCGIGHKV